MPTKSQFALGAALAFVIIDDLRNRIKARKAIDLFHEAVKSFDENVAVRDLQNEYLINLILDHNVPVGEFDRIMLRNMSPKSE